MKVIILLKYFLFVRHRDIGWRISHLFFYPPQHIKVDPSPAKKAQNHLSIVFLILLATAVFTLAIG
jgi:hypothetical protein